mgnify:CR=1 FL=1
MKKIYVNILLAICTLGLVYACFMSIYSDIAFDGEKSEREQAVIARLLQVRDAEEKFKMSHGYYCGTIDSLIDYVKNDRAVDKIIKEGELTDDQLESGMTEKEAVAKGLIRRDTVWVAASEILGISNPDSLKYVPVGKEGALIQLRKGEEYNPKTEEWVALVEFRASLDDYMDGVSPKRIKNLKSALKKLGRNKADLFDDNGDDIDGEWYGLRMGDLKDPNNKMAGNWE